MKTKGEFPASKTFTLFKLPNEIILLFRSFLIAFPYEIDNH